MYVGLTKAVIGVLCSAFLCVSVITAVWFLVSLWFDIAEWISLR